MYRAISNYDGSDTDKCIAVKVGDRLVSVHDLDSSWYVGQNERTGLTGVFPANCVEQVTSAGNPDAVKDKTTDRSFGNPMYSNSVIQRSDNILQLTTSDDHKPESSKGGSTDTTTSSENRERAGTLQKVTFADVQLERSISAAESNASWDESFQQSFSASSEVTRSTGSAGSNKPENAYHTIDDIIPAKIRPHTDKLLHSERGENAKLKAIYGCIAGLVVGILLYIILVYSFGYSHFEAAIFFGITTFLFCVGLALSSLCRCVMALLLPNFFTGKGRAVILSIILGVIVAGPFNNITFNAKESGKSMACVIDLIKNQTMFLSRQVAEPFVEMGEYVQKQQQELSFISGNTQSVVDKVKANLAKMDEAVASASSTLNTIYEECRKPITTTVNKCLDACNKIGIINIIIAECKAGCSALNTAALVCDALKPGNDMITETTKKTRAATEESFSYLVSNVELKGDYGSASNTSKDTKLIEKEVTAALQSKIDVFEVFFYIVKKLLTLTLLFLFIQSFWYLRNYLAKDGYDNVYITKRFRQLDETKPNAVLPLKRQEKETYVETSSIKLNENELKHSRLGIAQVCLHFLFAMITILFDYALYYLLGIVRKYGGLDLQIQGEGDIEVAVTGKGPIAEFYRVMLQETNINGGFSASLHLNKCLPQPSKPTSSTIPVLVSLYIVALLVCLLRGYGMRFRSTIAAYYYPEQEEARMEYLHKTIRHRRAGHLRFLRQGVQSMHKEREVKDKLRLSTWIRTKCDCVNRCLPDRNKPQCTGCEQRAGGFRKVQLKKCGGTIDSGECPAVFCQECHAALDGICPLCSVKDVSLRF